MDGDVKPLTLFQKGVYLFLVYLPGAMIGNLVGSFVMEYPSPPTFVNRLSVVLGMPFLNVINAPFAPLEVLATFRMQSQGQRIYGLCAILFVCILTMVSLMVLRAKSWNGKLMCLLFAASFAYNLCFLASSAAILCNKL